jgi:hypothetical protein
MLEICAVISGALIAFVAMTLWANSGRLKGDTE